MGNIGWTELLVIFLIVLLFFGAKRIPEIARALGKATKEFKDAKDGLIDEINSSSNNEANTAQTAKDSQEKSQNKDA